jgi:hypothetical protein
MMKSTHTVAVVKRRRNGNDPMGCGLGAGRASELDVSCERLTGSAGFCKNSDLLEEEKVAC